MASLSIIARSRVLTYRDKDWTFRAMMAMIRAGGLHGYKSLMRGLGCDPDPMLRKHGLDPSALDDPDNLISLVANLAVLEDSAAASGCPDFGLRLATLQNEDVLGTLSLCIRNAPTVASAIADAGRYLFLHSPAFQASVDQNGSWLDNCVVLRFELRLSEFAPQRQAVDCCVAHMAQLVELLGGGKFKLQGVSLPHAPLASEDVYRKFFKAPVWFAQPTAGLHVNSDFLTAAIPAANPLVRQLALESIARRIDAGSALLSERVRQAISHALGASKCTKPEIGAFLGVHPRTLQRRLEDEGFTFEGIREEALKVAALRFLRESNMPVKQIAGALAFSEQSAFTRSCRRWFGATPLQVRSRGAGREIAI